MRPGGADRLARQLEHQMRLSMTWTGAAVALAAAGIGLWWFTRPGEPLGQTLQAGGVVEISPATHQIRRVIAVPGPNDVEVGLGAAWVTGDLGESTSLLRLSGGLAIRTARIDLGPPQAMVPDDLAIGEGAAWVVAADRLYRVDPAHPTPARQVAGLAKGSLLSAVASGAGAVWVVDATRKTLSRVDPGTARVTDSIPIGTSAERVAVGEQAVWGTSSRSAVVLQISPALRRVVRGIPLGGAPSGIAAGAGSVWVTAGKRDAVARIDPVSHRVTWIPVHSGPTGVSATAHGVWVASSSAGIISRLDARTGKVVATVRVAARPYRIAADRDSVWVTLLGRPRPHEHAAAEQTRPRSAHATIAAPTVSFEWGSMRMTAPVSRFSR
jgi:streptogramin lyase